MNPAEALQTALEDLAARGLDPEDPRLGWILYDKRYNKPPDVRVGPSDTEAVPVALIFRNRQRALTFLTDNGEDDIWRLTALERVDLVNFLLLATTPPDPVHHVLIDAADDGMSIMVDSEALRHRLKSADEVVEVLDGLFADDV